jgi:uncharacterized protein
LRNFASRSEQTPTFVTFAFFLLAKQKKEGCRRATPGIRPQPSNEANDKEERQNTKMPEAQTFHILRLNPHDDLKAGIERAWSALQLEGAQAACIVSAVGSLSTSVIRHAAEPAGTVRTEPLELITLSGTLAVGGVHLHLSVADAQGRMSGGHLMPGCVVRTTTEVVIALLPGWAMGRELDAATGFRELEVRRL